MLAYLADIENGVLEARCNAQDLERINTWLIYLARCGVIPGDTEAESLLETDIEDLEDEGRSFEFASCCDEDIQFILIPTCEDHKIEAFFCKSWLSKKWHQTKKFIKDHKKEILIGAAVVVGAVVVVAAVSCAVGAAAAGAAASAAAAANNSASDQSTSRADDVLIQTEEIRQDALSKDLIALNDPSFPAEENARILGLAGAQAALEKWQNTISYNTCFSSDKERIESHSTDTSYLIQHVFSKPIPWDHSHSFNENVYLARGAYASDIKLYDMAYSDYDKALQINPHNADVYLNRALTYFETGQIDKATADFQKHVQLRAEPMQDMKQFSLGFVRGLTKGVKDSGQGLCEFAGDLVFHPISTANKMYESGMMLFELTKSAQWQQIAQVLSTEAYELATQWESLSFERRGELSGYVFGKHGSDLVIPMGGIKIAKGGMGELKILASAASAASKAEKALVLESVVLGTGKIADASFAIKTSTGLQELGEVGFINHIEHLKNNQIFHFTDTTLKHMHEPGRWVPTSLMKEVIEHPLAVVPDPRNAIQAKMYYSQISKNGKLYNIEVLYDPIENEISHFKYTDDALGPLDKIRK